MLTVWSRERGTELLNAVKFSNVDWQSGETPPNPKGDVVLCLGKVPHEYFTKQGILPKNRTITSLRGLAHKANLWGREVLLMFSYSTAIGAVDYRKYVDLQLDFGAALRLETTGSLSPKLGDYRYVKDFTEVVAKLKQRIANGEERIDVALDLETLGLDPYAVAYTETKGKKETSVPAAYIITIQVTTAEGEADVVYFESKDEMQHWVKKHKAELEYILNCQNLVMNGANLKFDLHWLKVHADVDCSNFKFDTTLVGSCLDENRSNALDVHTKIYTATLGGYSDLFDKTVDKGRMDLVNKDFLLGYAGGDTDATWRIKQVMKKELLKQPRLAAFYVNVLHPAGRAFEKVEQTGVHLDLDRFNELEIEVSREMSRLANEARKLIGGRLWAKHHDDTRAEGINLTKASLIKDYMFSPMGLNLRPKVKTEKTGEPSTAMEHLELFAEHPDAKEFVSLLSEYGSASKTLSTYLTGFRKHLRSDGRFHPSYFLFAGNRDAGDGGTNCMPYGELVLTARGYLPVESVVCGDRVITHKGRVRKVIDVIDNGVKPILKVTLADGRTLRTTENHPYLVEGVWVDAKDLQLGMNVTTYGGAEEWKTIPEWQSYEVSTWGRVRHKDTGRIRKLFSKGEWGHLKVTLSRNGCQARGEDKKDIPVHKLVLSTFVGASNGSEVRHLNGLAWDNNLTNLTYGTSKENSQDAVRHGTTSKRLGAQAKLNEEAVAYIRSCPKAERGWEYTNKKLAEKYGVCPRLVRAVRNGTRWEDKTVSVEYVYGSSQIVSITIQPKEKTLGLTVEEDNSHVTGGIVTHNTGRLSCKDPAFQCLVGETLVLTSKGDQTIESIVSGYEQGKEYTVLTHTGKWKKVIGVYRNGIKKVFSVRLKSGRVVNSTENHPYLTQRGWVRTDQLLEGDTCYELGTQNTELYQSNLLQLGSHEKPLFIGDQQGLSTLRGQGDKATQTLGVIPNFPKGYGGEASQGVFDRAQGCERGLRAEQLLLGNTTGTSQQQNQLQAHNMEWGNQDRSTVGERVRYNEGQATLSPQCWYADGASLDEAEPWDRAIFQAVEVESIDYWGEYETYDLTVDGSHSFVANGIVVHNTLPKHTDWGKKIRSCYTAPEGHVVGEFDYSQGELRVVACVANEENMIEAYRNGKDLHTLTAANLLDKTYEEMIALKKTDKDQFDVFRQYGKPCNFGLLYGMSAAGLVEYARINYGVYFTLEQATEFREQFLYKAYPMLPVYHQHYKNMAKRYGQVESPLGRIRHLPLINSRFSDIRSGTERQAINSPIQGCLSDMLCWAMAICNETGFNKISPDFGAIHDATYKYIPEDRVDEVVERQLEIMENLPFHKVGWNPQLKFIADAKVGHSMGELKEWSKAS